MTVSNELLDSLLADYKKPEDLIGEDGLLKQLTKKLVERALEAEMAEHLGHARNESVANPAGNTRNGKSKKTLKGEFGELPINIPRDRHGSFELHCCRCNKPKQLDANAPEPRFDAQGDRAQTSCSTTGEEYVQETVPLPSGYSRRHQKHQHHR